ncbi:hypothetical protein P7C70_g8945, partial [Phenoliferia sp. Uapishka_3]
SQKPEATPPTLAPPPSPSTSPSPSANPRLDPDADADADADLEIDVQLGLALGVELEVEAEVELDYEAARNVNETHDDAPGEVVFPSLFWVPNGSEPAGSDFVDVETETSNVQAGGVNDEAANDEADKPVPTKKLYKATPSIPETFKDLRPRHMELEVEMERMANEVEALREDLRDIMTCSQRKAAYYRRQYRNFPGGNVALAAYKKKTKELVKSQKWLEEVTSTQTNSIVSFAGATVTAIAPLAGPLPAIVLTIGAALKFTSAAYTSGIGNSIIKEWLEARAKARAEASGQEDVEGQESLGIFERFKIGEEGMATAKRYASYVPVAWVGGGVIYSRVLA